MGISFQGDPASALLEVLDPEQNVDFTDHYLEIPFDLSSVLFITTANVTDTIPPALKDRMELIEIPGYTDAEKKHIARDYILPKIYEEYNTSKKTVSISSAAIKRVIREYTREAGVRNLDRNLSKILRRSLLQLAEGQKKIKISVRNIEDFLGVPKFKDSDLIRKPEVGVSTGLAWTAVGGETMYIEVLPVPGKQELILTGQLGDVMKESAHIALSFSKKMCENHKDFFEKHDFHVHVPEGAVPKDGPSAGITLITAIVSAVTGKAVRHDIAMTGEITLRGKVLPIGGLKEKLMAAYRSKMTKVLLPSRNKKDLEDVPKEIKDNLEFIFVDNVEDALKEVLVD
jgi:ATP-dependent Lon protease